MNAVWQLQEARNHLSELVERATRRGAQTITKHGRPVAVVLSAEEYAKLRPQKSLLQALRECPAPGLAGVIAARSREKVRSLDLG
jgi:prevent-host-death family protein